MIRTYSELIEMPTFLERFRYLKLNGVVGETTFAHNRWMNQQFYKSREWKQFRRDVILRDKGFDLAVEGFNIYGRIIIHHINPITEKDILNRTPMLLDLENAVCMSDNTHKAVHYGDENLLAIEPVIRTPGDTIPWR